MNSKVRLLNWTKGLDSVCLIKLIREVASIPLNEALDIVNRFLAGEIAEMVLPSAESASQFIEQVRGLGVHAERADIALSATASSAAFRKAMEDTFQEHDELYRRLAQ